MRTVIFSTSLTLAVLLPLTVSASPPQPEPEFPVSLHIDAPSSNDGLALLSDSGWPVTIKMNIELPQEGDYPAYAVQPNFPVRGDWGFLIFDDPDGCLNPPAPGWNAVSEACGTTPPPSDEVYLEFWPDVDMAGAEDFAGNDDRQFDLLDSNSSGGPEFDSWSEGSVNLCTPDTEDPDCDQFGPATGGEVTDGFGLGADDDIPGLVVIAQYGIGNTYNEPLFEQTSPVGARNLAGLVNSVSYDLSDLEKSKGRPPRTTSEFSRVWAHINMPPDVVRNIIQYDACVGEVTFNEDDEVASCAGENLWRIDGGDAEITPEDFNRVDGASKFLFESTVFKIRAFLVSGQAPNELFDMNDDGIVDSADAVAAGYNLLSNEDSFEFLQLDEDICFGGGSNGVLFDLDGNGYAFLPIICGPSPGDLGRPPR